MGLSNIEKMWSFEEIVDGGVCRRHHQATLDICKEEHPCIHRWRALLAEQARGTCTFTTERCQLERTVEEMEAMSYNEGTYPASACSFIAKNVFRPLASEEARASTHRAVIMVVDGMTAETRAEDYISAFHDRGVQLLVLNITDDRREHEMRDKVQRLWSAAAQHHELLDHNDVASLPTHVASLLLHHMQGVSEQLQAAQGSSSGQLAAPLSQMPLVAALHTVPQAPTSAEAANSFCRLASHMGSAAGVAESRGGATASPFTTSAASGSRSVFDFLAALGLGAGSSQVEDAAQEQLAEQVEQLASGALAHAYADVASSSLCVQPVADAQALWNAAVGRLEQRGMVDAMATALEQVLPINRFTRMRGELRGTSLHVPGLVKALASDYQYKRYFKGKTAGGRPEYCVALILDVSLSMHGQRASFAMETAAALVEAQSRMGADNFILLTFGSEVRLVKSADQPWDAAAMYALLRSLTFDQQTATMDALALDTAVGLLCRSSGRGAKKVLVLTDGYGTSGAGALAHAIRRAEDAGVEVLALSVGEDQSMVPQVYPRWIEARSPEAVPAALEALYSAPLGEGGGSGAATAGWEGSQGLMNALAAVAVGGDATAEDALATMRPFFSHLVSKLGEERDLQVQHCQPDSMTIDLCFVMDATGSMGPWLQAASSQVKAIATAIVPAIEKQYKGLDIKIKFALVAYRDVCDGAKQWPAHLDFTSDVGAIAQELAKITAEGGGDEAEDILPALERAAQLSWTAKARFLLLVADSPAHGSECHDLGAAGDHYLGGSPSGVTVTQAMSLLAAKSVDLMLCKVKAQALDKMEAAFRSSYDNTSEGRIMDSVNLFDNTLGSGSSSSSSGRFHFVLVLDSSGSMNGQPTVDVVNACNTLLAARRTSQTSDVVSVIRFDTRAGLEFQQQPVHPPPSIAASCHGYGGGTDFYPPLQTVHAVLRSSPTHFMPVLVFMSDGEDNANSQLATTAMGQVRRDFAAQGLQVHTVAFGSSRIPRLEELAREGGGSFHHAITGMSLAAVFASIGAGCSGAEDRLVHKFGEILSNAISLKVMADYL